MEDGQVNVSTSQPRQLIKRKLSLEEIPNGNIKNHLTYLKLQYSQNMEALNTLGLDDPSSRSLSGLGGKARELKIINNEILNAIDLPGLGDREDVITFLTEQAPTTETTPTEVTTSILAPSEETTEVQNSKLEKSSDPVYVANQIKNVRSFDAVAPERAKEILMERYKDKAFVDSVLKNLYETS